MLTLENISNSKILISALDWGFGHTTRTAVLIRELLKQENQIIFAGELNQVNFVKEEFPLIRTEILNGYNITLNTSENTYFQIFKQLPKLKKAIITEQNWVSNQVRNENFDIIISDNRYGFYNKKIPSIILTHQTSLQIPFGKKIVNYFIRKQIHKFSYCWIPDTENRALSGKLSVGKLKIPTYFIGPLSRFNVIHKDQYKYDYLFLVSGPSPEREFYLEKVLNFISKHNLNAAIATTFKIVNRKDNNKINLFEQKNSLVLQTLINDSKVIVSKSGYTTIMDFVSTKKEIILFPTKGQFEQIYLAQHHKLVNSKITDRNLDFTELMQ